MGKQVRALSFITAAVLILAMAAGCAGTPDDEPAESIQSPSASQPQEGGASGEAAPPDDAAQSAGGDGGNVSPSPISDETYTLYYMRGMSPALSSVDVDWSNMPLAAEMEKLTNIHIEYEAISMLAYAEQLSIRIASGDTGDLIGSYYSNYNMGFDEAINQGIILTVNEYYDAGLMPNFKYLRETDENYGKNSITDGGNLAYVANLAGEDQVVDGGAVARGDWLDALGWNAEDIVTYDDYYNLLRAMKTEYGATFLLPAQGVAMGSYLAAGFDNISVMNTMGNKPWSQHDGVVRLGWYEDAFYDYLKMVNQWYEEGLIYQDFYTGDPAYATQDDALSDSFGVFYFTYARMSTTVSMSDNPDYKLIGIRDPVLVEGQTNHVRHNTRAAGNVDTDGATVIAATCSNPEYAARWLDAWFSDEGIMIANYGIEGVTYEVVDGKSILTALILNNPDGLSPSTALEAYSGAGPTINYFERHTQYLGQVELDAIEVWNNYNDGADVLPMSLSMTEDESAVYAARFSEITTYASGAILEFIIGTREINEQEFEDYRSTLRDLGAEECIACWQAAYNRWLSR